VHGFNDTMHFLSAEARERAIFLINIHMYVVPTESYALSYSPPIPK